MFRYKYIKKVWLDENQICFFPLTRLSFLLPTPHLYDLECHLMCDFVTNDERDVFLHLDAAGLLSVEYGRVSECDKTPILHRALHEVIQRKQI